MTHDAISGLNYTYDVENRVTGAGGYTYTYDSDGNRVEKTNGSTGTIYWYASIGIIGESDLAGTLKSEYVFFGGERVARKDFPGNSVSYYFSDHLKTTDIVTDAQGNIKNESDFYPWGGELQFFANDSNHYKFTGKERDAESGLDYFGARYYSNGLGRFITPDWAAKPTAIPFAVLGDPQTLNLYTYVRNIPTTMGDPDGHCIPFCQVVLWIANRIADDVTKSGGGRAAAKDAGIGALKAGPQLAFNNLVRMPVAVLLPAPLVMPALAKMSDPAPIRSTNQTQADASFVTQTAATALLPGLKGSSSLVGFSETESAMLGQSLKNLRGAGYDTSAFQQLVKSTDMPAGTCAMCLSTSPTGAALGDGAFTSQEMLDHTMEEELRHLGQDLSKQWLGVGDAAAKEAEVNGNRKFPEPKR
jgi:RHS repeat-associated protein